MTHRAWAVLAVAAGTHVIHDGFSDALFVLLPIWAAELHLTLTQVGLVKTAYSGGMAGFQIPAGLLAERWGERWLLALGTAVTACGFVAVAGWAAAFPALLVLLLLAGLGSGVQHPLASSLVSKAYETAARRTALGTYNFAGDLGKICVPAAVALAASFIGWRTATAAYAVVGLVAALLIRLCLSDVRADEPVGGSHHASEEPIGWGIRDLRGFQALAAIGMIDTATRTGMLTFLPFALIAKGLTVAGVGGALALLFAGGAVGKFVCGVVAERVGVIRTVVLTEAATAIGIVAIVVAPGPLALAVLLPLGIALNGTSSVLYGTVADLVRPERRSRAYGLFYTLSVGASSLAPTLYGLVGDAVGVPATLVIIALVVLVTIPLCLALRSSVSWGRGTLPEEA
ncbi:MAG: MFS transporter [Candidatus Rokuibacteriota bacterium]